jgi:hypothetical protein
MNTKECMQQDGEGVDASVVNITTKLQQLSQLQIENASLTKEV